jgi:hypothetical protein
MARYNTVISSATASTTAAFASPGSGAFTKLTGTTYTVTIGDPILFAGQSQTFYNAASGTITLAFSSTGAGVFVGPGGSGTTSQLLSTGTTITVFSDGTNWVTLGAGGGPVTATTGSFSSDITLTGATPTINFNNTAPTIATTSSGSTASVFNTNVTTLNIGGAASTIAIGVNAGTTTLRGRLAIAGSGSGTVTFQLATAATSVRCWIDTGTDVIVNIGFTGSTLVEAGSTLSGTLDTLTTSGTYNATSNRRSIKYFI